MRVSLIIALCLHYVGTVMSQVDFTDTILKQLDSIVLGIMYEKQIPGLAYGIIHKNELVHQNVFGFSNLEHQVPTKYETVFELASLTKQFIAVAVLKLAEQGQVDLDIAIDNYLDSLPEPWKMLTLRQLLSHTAGLAPQHAEWQTLKDGGWPKYVSRKDLWNAALQDSIYADPGTRFIYHNTGYFLATTIIEKITGLDHRDFFQAYIFDPLQMEYTFFEDQIRIVPHLASGYTLRDGKLCKIWRVGQEEIGGGQGLYSNMPDLIKWIQALNSGAIISQQSKSEMFSPIRLKDQTIFHYGLGWFLPLRNGIQYYYHNGITGPEILKIPSYELDIIVLTNLGEGEFDEGDYWGTANKIAEFLVPEFIYKPVKIPMPVLLAEEIKGRYAYSDGSILEIDIIADKIILKDNWGTEELIFIGDGKFALKETAIYFQFMTKDKILITEEAWENDYAIRISN